MRFHSFLTGRPAIFAVGFLLTVPAAAQNFYHFYESGSAQPMVLAASEIAVKAAPGSGEAKVTEALHRHVPQSSTLEKWDQRYLMFIPPPHDVHFLTGKSAPMRQEADLMETAPVLYLVQEAAGNGGWRGWNRDKTRPGKTLGRRRRGGAN